MTLEELQQEVEEMKASNAALVAKNKELLGEVKRYKKNDAIDPEAHEQLKAELEDTRSALAKAEKLSKGEIEKLTKLANDRDSALQSHLIDGGLSDALAKAGVAPQMMDAVKSLLRQKAAVTQGDNGYQAMLDGKPLSAAINEWASSDQGKHFVLANGNSGGGATGGSGGKATNFKDMSESDRNALYRENPQLFQQLANKGA